MAGDEKGNGGDIRRYGAKVIVVHWLFIITFMPLLYTGLLLMRDWFAHEFHIYGYEPLLKTFEGTDMWHEYLGVAVLVVGLAHVLAHMRQKEKPILPKNVGEDLAANIHNILYIFHMARRRERGASEKYHRNQRMTYVGTAYVISLSAVTALFVYLELFEELGLLLHVIAGVLVLFISAYRIASLIRDHDGVAIKSILATGRMPEWYVRKNHFLWYRELKGGYKEPPDPEYEKFESNPVSETEVVEG